MATTQSNSKSNESVPTETTPSTGVSLEEEAKWAEVKAWIDSLPETGQAYLQERLKEILKEMREDESSRVKARRIADLLVKQLGVENAKAWPVYEGDGVFSFRVEVGPCVFFLKRTA